jgi:uncharacterized protein (UPF0332 family)
MEKIKSENKRVNGKDYLKAARERLKSAEVLLKAGSYGDSVSRSYYAFLDAATAALLTKNLIPRSHAGAITLFSLHFIKSGIMEKKYATWFKRIKKDREEADYKHKKKFSRKDAGEILKEAEEFVGIIRKLLPKLLSA